MDALKDVGAIAGLASFLGLAVMALLYFAQARDVRRLRENASFLLEDPAPGEPKTAAPAPAPAPKPGRSSKDTAPPASDAEAFRRAELARQADDRRRRFEQRRRRGGAGIQDRLADLPGGTPGFAVGAVLLIAGLIFAGTSLLGGGDEAPKGTGGPAASSGKAQVAVFNGTAEAGLAATFAGQIKKQGFGLTTVTNSPTETVTPTSSVMFDKGGQQAANQIASLLKIQRVEAVTAELRAESDGASVVVVLGEDKKTSGA